MSRNIACSVFALSFLTLAACSVAPGGDDAESEESALRKQCLGLGPAMGTGLGRMVAPYVPADSKSLEQLGVTPNGIIVIYTPK